MFSEYGSRFPAGTFPRWFYLALVRIAKACHTSVYFFYLHHLRAGHKMHHDQRYSFLAGLLPLLLILAQSKLIASALFYFLWSSKLQTSCPWRLVRRIPPACDGNHAFVSPAPCFERLAFVVRTCYRLLAIEPCDGSPKAFRSLSSNADDFEFRRKKQE
jgi:hypothetical protein